MSREMRFIFDIFEFSDLSSKYVDFQNIIIIYFLSFNLFSWQESSEQKEEIAALKATVAGMRG